MLRALGIGRLTAASLIWLGLFACTGEAYSTMEPNTSPVAPTASPATQTPTPASATADEFTTPVQTTTPMATELPPNVFALEARRWPEEGNLLTPGGEEAEFGFAIGDLDRGDYLLLAEEEAGISSVYSLETSERQGLVRPPPGPYGDVQSDRDLGFGIVGFQVSRRSWWFYDAVARGSWGLGPTCNGIPPHWMSPGGGWIGAICEDFVQMHDIPFEHVVMEVISSREGVGVRIAIANSPNQRDLPYLAWIAEGRALVSRVWVEGELRACTVAIENSTMYCPPLGLDSTVSYGTDTSPNSPMIPFVDFEFPPRAALVPRECFERDIECPGVQELQIEQSTIVITTSDPEVIWWIEPLGPDPTTEIGVVDTGTGKASQIASLGGDYSSRAVCPDGSCLLLFQLDNGLNWRLNLDGSLEVLPFRGDLIIGSFRIS